MRVAFRVDASITIGTGHVMRCLSLADALRGRGAECDFVCRNHNGHLMDVIQAWGFSVYPLPGVDALVLSDSNDSEYGHWLGADLSTDALETMAALRGAHYDWLIVDHYAIDQHWERPLKDICRNMLVIDDLFNRIHSCDYLLNPNLQGKAERYHELVPETCTIFAGAQFALLRPEFALLRTYSRQRRSQAKIQKLLITMGGVDKDNITQRVLDALGNMSLAKDLSVVIIVGSKSPWISQLQAYAKKFPYMELLVDAKNVAELMSDCDIAIGAAGTTALERCCMSLPTLTIVLADNQREGAQALSRAGAVCLARVDHLSEDLHAGMRQLMDGRSNRQMQEAAYQVCDGEGVTRVVDLMYDAN